MPGQGLLRHLALLVGGAVLLSQSSAVLAAAPTPEYLIKAAYLYNFALFVEWPDRAFTEGEDPIVIGVFGSDPFGYALDRTVQDKRIRKRPLVVRRLQTLDDLRHCHILFVGSSETSRTQEVLSRLQGLPILVVGEAPRFAERGGTVNFTIEENKVRFEINVDVARRAGLRISAKLLNLARIVRDR